MPRRLGGAALTRRLENRTTCLPQLCNDPYYIICGSSLLLKPHGQLVISIPVHLAVVANLAGMEGFPEMFGLAIGSDGSVNPLSQLFRAHFFGVETGPMISQVRRPKYVYM